MNEDQDLEQRAQEISVVLDDVSGAAVASDTRVHLARAALVALLAEVARLEQQRDEAHANTSEGLQWLRDDISAKVETIATLEAALAVAREREQRIARELRDPIEAAMRWIGGTAVMAPGSRRHSSALAGVLLALAALVDEPAVAEIGTRGSIHPGVAWVSTPDPAAATLAEPEQAEAQGEAAASRSGQGSPDGNAQGSGSASAAADGGLFADLRTAAELSQKSLEQIGDGDWTPQDSVHMHIVCMVEKFLAVSAAADEPLTDADYAQARNDMPEKVPE